MKTCILAGRKEDAKEIAWALMKGDTAIDQGGWFEDANYIVTWATKALCTLNDPKDYDPAWSRADFELLPIIPEQFKYKIKPHHLPRLMMLKKLLNRSDIQKFITATEASREGELAAAVFYTVCGLNPYGKKMFRRWSSGAIEANSIEKDLSQSRPAKAYRPLFHAAQARQFTDWLIGINLTRAVNARLKGSHSIGRVQTCILSMVVKRYLELKHFTPQPYWILKATFTTANARSWEATWHKEDKTDFAQKDDALEIIRQIHESTGTVKKLTKKKKKINPPFLLNLTGLQRKANQQHGITADTTLKVAKKLHNHYRCISYPVTVSRHLAPADVHRVKSALTLLETAYPQMFELFDRRCAAISNRQIFNQEKIFDHSAIIPLSALPEDANEVEKFVYHIILRQFAAAFCPPYEYETEKISVQIESHEFKAKLKRTRQLGWKKIIPQDEPEAEETEISLNETVQLTNARLLNLKTKKPIEYSDSILIKALEKPATHIDETNWVLKFGFGGYTGIGTHKTRSKSIEALIAKGYLERHEKKLRPTTKAIDLIQTLSKFPVTGLLCKPVETAKMEMALDRIASGYASIDDYLAKVKKFISDAVSEFKENHFSQLASGKLSAKCPVCEADVFESEDGFYCANERTCRFYVKSTIAGRKLSKQEVETLLAVGRTGLLDGFVSRKKRPFSAHLKFGHQGNGRAKVIFDFPNIQSTEVLGPCPDCKGPVTEYSRYYACKSQNCEFKVWKTIKGRKIEPEKIKQLLSKGSTGRLYGFCKGQQKYSAAIVLKNGNPSTIRFQF